MKKKNDSSSGVQTPVHFAPRFGRATLSRMNSTPSSSTFIGPVGTSRGCRMYRRTIAVITTKRIVATTHSINTCLLTDRSMPYTVGKWING